MDAWILPEWKFKVRYLEDGVVSVNHEYFVFAVDQHHVPVGAKKRMIFKWAKFGPGAICGVLTDSKHLYFIHAEDEVQTLIVSKN